MSQAKLQRDLIRELIRCGYKPDMDGRVWSRTRELPEGGEATVNIEPQLMRNDELIAARKKFEAEADEHDGVIIAGETVAEPAEKPEEGNSDARPSNTDATGN